MPCNLNNRAERERRRGPVGDGRSMATSLPIAAIPWLSPVSTFGFRLGPAIHNPGERVRAWALRRLSKTVGQIGSSYQLQIRQTDSGADGLAPFLTALLCSAVCGALMCENAMSSRPLRRAYKEVARSGLTVLERKQITTVVFRRSIRRPLVCEDVTGPLMIAPR
ncbi:hypothetical protein EI94DRAFT_814772 [Lactarius quietus]|nr:hypothetical protein EI94DRAFT_814772 [Lactarius quietus]